MGKSLGKQSIMVQRLKVKDLDLNKKLSQSVRDKEGGISADVAKCVPVVLQVVKKPCKN